MAFTSKVGAHHPLEAELLALQRSLIHLSNTPPTSEISNPGIQIEGDCLVLITTIKNSGHLRDMMPLWKRTMNMLSTMASWTVHYCRHSANRVADILRVANLVLIDLNVKHLGFRTLNNLIICHA